MGQKRRLSVATALSSKADIILLDEPTFGLDSHNTFQLIELFKKASLVVKPSLWLHTTRNHSSLSTRRLIVEDNQLIEEEGESHV